MANNLIEVRYAFVSDISILMFLFTFTVFGGGEMVDKQCLQQ